MNLVRLRWLMALIALAVLGSGVALAAVIGSDETGQAESTGAETPRPTPSRSPASSLFLGPPVLLPDARSLPAGELSVETTPEGRRLRFSATLVNDGPGPIEVVPSDSQSCPTGQRYAEQRLYADVDGDGTFDRAIDRRTETRPAGCMLDHPDHDHWHFDAMARYALSPVGSTTPISENTKVSFCLRDNVAVASGSVGQPQHYGECETRLALQGISPGWADVYTAKLADQVLELPDGLADGSYCLHTEADPFRLLREVDPTDNAAVLTVQLTGETVAAAPSNLCRPLAPLDSVSEPPAG